MNWLNSHWLQLTLIAGVIVLLVFGRNKILPRVQENKFILWLAWIVTAVCGLVLGWALIDVAGWVTSLPTTFGGVVASLGAILAVVAGWWAISMLVEMFRDLADGVPDGDARKAALWVPTLAPAGLSAAWGIVTNPRGIGTGITAAVIAGISLVFLFKIVKAALAGKKGETVWKWFAAAASLLCGLLMIPLLAFADSLSQQYLPGNWPTGLRIVIGFLGVGLLIWAIVDLVPKKKQGEKRMSPDEGVRAFLTFGLPALVLCGAVAVGAISDAATEQGNILVGSMK
ncbi:hypothetical protein [Actinoplanes sp. URMC 104]|uniref:hypothetical protein n=1 Tax=Actinoplanes sp. URMC 104 TaxID=3423409 RepID=UPI003F1A2117